MITTTTLLAESGKVRLITIWILSVLVAPAFLGAGVAKLAGAAAMVDLFDKVGRGQWFRYFTGLLEVAGSIGLLIPRYAFYAAGLLAVIMVGAIIARRPLTCIPKRLTPPSLKRKETLPWRSQAPQRRIRTETCLFSVWRSIRRLRRKADANSSGDYGGRN